MKHWLLIGTIIVIGVILLTRSRVSQTSTVPPASTTTQPATSPATTRSS